MQHSFLFARYSTSDRTCLLRSVIINCIVSLLVRVGFLSDLNIAILVCSIYLLFSIILALLSKWSLQNRLKLIISIKDVCGEDKMSLSN